MKRTALRRRATLRAKKPLRRKAPLQRTQSMAATEAQRAAVAHRQRHPTARAGYPVLGTGRVTTPATPPYALHHRRRAGGCDV